VTDGNLAERNAIVTGGGSGIGRAIALDLAAAGVNTLIVGRRRDALDETVKLSKGPGRLIALPADIREPADRARIVAAAVERHSGLDILVNNAGVTSLTPLLDYTVEEWRNVIATHAEASFFLAQAAIPELRKSTQARIINIGSVYGSLGINNDFYGERLPWDNVRGAGPVREFAYAAAKGAILQLTRELATAVGRWGITVNSVTPGMIPVDSNPMPDTTRERLSRSTPLGRVGRPEEIAAVVRFIAGAGSSFMTGAEVRVDGGWSIW
jgi:NAD(P)-dependent dehydrogenase (short-subunit alcohol dehydrogenase family)